MATFKNKMEEYELTKKQKDDHTYDHIKMENALNLTWKQWFQICTLFIIVCLVSTGLGFTVTRFSICGNFSCKQIQSYNSTTLDQQIAIIAKTLSEIQTQTTDITRQVSVTMCLKGYSTLSTNSTVKFPDVHVQAITGFTEIFKLRLQNTGVYVCEYPGLYLISVTIISDTYDAQFMLYKNADSKMKGLVSKHPQQQSNSDNFEHAVTIIIALRLDVDDSLRVVVGKHRIRIAPYGSCLTNVKLM